MNFLQDILIKLLDLKMFVQFRSIYLFCAGADELFLLSVKTLRELFVVKTFPLFVLTKLVLCLTLC